MLNKWNIRRAQNWIDGCSFSLRFVWSEYDCSFVVGGGNGADVVSDVASKYSQLARV